MEETGVRLESLQDGNVEPRCKHVNLTAVYYLPQYSAYYFINDREVKVTPCSG